MNRQDEIIKKLIVYLADITSDKDLDLYETLEDIVGMTENEIDMYSGNFDGEDFSEEDDTLYIDDITGTLGEWLDRDCSEIPTEIMGEVKKTYNLAVKEIQNIVLTK